MHCVWQTILVGKIFTSHASYLWILITYSMWQLHGSNAIGNASASIWWRHHDGSDVHNATRTRGRCKLWLFYYCFCYRNEPVLLVTYLSESQTDTQTENCNSMRCSDDFGWNCIFVTIIIVPELYEWFVRLQLHSWYGHVHTSCVFVIVSYSTTAFACNLCVTIKRCFVVAVFGLPEFRVIEIALFGTSIILNWHV